MGRLLGEARKLQAARGTESRQKKLADYQYEPAPNAFGLGAINTP